MKELNFEQMENIQGGVNCFLVGAWAAASLVPPGNIFANPYLMAHIQYCWNS